LVRVRRHLSRVLVGREISAFIGSKWAVIAAAVAVAGGAARGVTGSASGACLASADCYPKPVNSGCRRDRHPVRALHLDDLHDDPEQRPGLTDCLFTSGVTITTTGSGRDVPVFATSGPP
jgi:hypothetical protein